MSPVGCSKSVIGVNVAPPGKLSGEIRIVILLFFVKSEVLQKQDFAVLKAVYLFLNRVSHAVANKFHR
jgi:hypothetical protein